MLKTDKGFTLLELLVVIALVIIIATAALPNILAARGRANDSAAIAYLRHCVTSVESSREIVTQQLPKATSCEDDLLGASRLNRPQSVKSSAIDIDLSEDNYTIVVISITNKVFKHDGRTFLLGKI